MSRKRMNGFKIGKTGHEVVRISSDRRKHLSIYYLTVKGIKGGSSKLVLEAKNIPELKRDLIKRYSKKKKSIQMTKQQKLLYNLSIDLTLFGEEESAESGAEGMDESEFDEDPELKEALKFLVIKGYYNTKIVREGLSIINKYNLDPEAIFFIFNSERWDDFSEIKESYGLNKSEANKLAEFYMKLDWEQQFDTLVEEARKKGWKGK